MSAYYHTGIQFPIAFSSVGFDLTRTHSSHSHNVNCVPAQISFISSPRLQYVAEHCRVGWKSDSVSAEMSTVATEVCGVSKERVYVTCLLQSEVRVCTLVSLPRGSVAMATHENRPVACRTLSVPYCLCLKYL
jgi:hypothetical protein